MMKSVLMLALVGACAGVPVAQDGLRGDEPTNVLIHSGYANIRRQGRMHDSGAFNSQRFKKGRTLDVDTIKSDLEKVDPAPVFKGFSDEEYQSEETLELKEKVEAASKRAIEKMEKDIMNAITSIPSENVNEATTQASSSEKTEVTDSEEEVVAITENTIEETTTSYEAPTTNTPIAAFDTTSIPEVIETESEKVKEEMTTISEEVPATNAPIASTSIPESVTENTSSEATTITIEEAPDTINPIKTTSIPEADTEKSAAPIKETTYTPIASTSVDNTEEVPVSTTVTSKNQQPSEDIDLGSVEEVIS